MIKIGELAVTIDTGHFVLLTNGVGDDDKYLPYEGFLFDIDGTTLIGWTIKKIEGWSLRPATKEETNYYMPQYQYLLSEIAKKKP